MKSVETQVLRPCPSKKTLLHRLVEGSLKGPLRWYMQLHVDHCKHCSPAYKALVALRNGLSKMGQEGLAESLLSEESWKRIDEACDHS